jgi:hypothetical protein
VCGHERLETVRFLCDHDGEALTTVWVGKAEFDFHTELSGKPVKTGMDGGGVAIADVPRSLERHAELAARDLFFERLDVGSLLEEEVCDAGDDAGFVASDDGDAGELSHWEHELHELARIEIHFYGVNSLESALNRFNRFEFVNLLKLCNFSWVWLLKQG